VNDDCLALFQELKLKKKYKYIIFGLNEGKTEIIPLKNSTSVDYEEFLVDLPEKECRWAVYDFEFEKEDAGKRNKIIFYQWCVSLRVVLMSVTLTFYFRWQPLRTDLFLVCNSLALVII